ncbi:Glycosyltransferase family 4 protein [Nitrospira tepida]|uniref:Glycosyltransferase family 4 protein n=1 Tax=Nitrospira tepida TaxID=2973512 RepID=A0AA86T8I5_9BACT|nr:glycosyltransferase family 4 protein [Nitrospira tepida]CAI4032268.1 Glycosyltransferase family 4 protein [Nitrospira tepida]
MAPYSVIHVITRLDHGGSAENTMLTMLGHDRSHFRPMLVVGDPDRWSAQGGLEATWQQGHRLNQAGAPWIIIKDLVRHPSPIRDLKSLWALLCLFRRTKPAIVHTHTSKAGALGRIAAWLASVPVIVHTPHGHVFYGHFSRPVSWLFLQIERILALVTTHFIALTTAERDDHVVRMVGRAEDWSVIPSGIDLARFRSVEPRPDRRPVLFHCPVDSILVGTVGWLTEVKGHRRLIEAFARLAPSRPSLFLVIIGTGELHDDLAALASRLDIGDRVRFLGHRHDIAECLAALDLFVFPSQNEGMGRALIEAMAAALPVVATNVGGIPGIIEQGRTGLLVPPGDSPALAAAMAELLDDPVRAQAMGQAARESIGAEFNAAGMVRAVESVYVSCLQPASWPRTATSP